MSEIFADIIKKSLSLESADSNRVRKALEKLQIYPESPNWEMKSLAEALGYKLSIFRAVSNNELIQSGGVSFFSSCSNVLKEGTSAVGKQWKLYALVCTNKFYLITDFENEKVGTIIFDTKKLCVEYFQREYCVPELHWFADGWRFTKDRELTDEEKMVVRINRNYLTSGAQKDFKKMISKVPKDLRYRLLIK